VVEEDGVQLLLKRYGLLLWKKITLCNGRGPLALVEGDGGDGFLLWRLWFPVMEEMVSCNGGDGFL
jgi:hypothetical protein